LPFETVQPRLVADSDVIHFAALVAISDIGPDRRPRILRSEQ
jgi:hypothetical protein